MIARIVEFSLVQRFFVLTLGFVLLFGGLYAFHLLDIVAYPDPSPPMVELITQYPGWSAEEIERQITIPIEVALNGMPGLTDIRSLSIFGLSDIKIYFNFDTDIFRDRQEVLNRLLSVTLPPGAQPTLSPWWAIAEIYRYELTGPPDASLTDLKTIQDWQVRREFKRVPGVIDVTTFGGTTKEYHVDIDPGKLISYGVSLSQVMTALANSNANVGGNYLTVGAQSYNIRGLGLINRLEDIENVMVTEKEGTPIFVKTLGKVAVGHRVRLGKVGIDDRDDVVEGVVLLQRGYKALPVLDRVRAKVADLNGWKLPSGVKIKTFYDRTALIHTTVETVTDILISGMVLVFVILFVFLGHLRAALIVALTIPLSLLFTFTMMVLIGQSANLISLGAIDFGIIVDATLIMVESIFYHLAHGKTHGLTIHQQIVRAARQVGQPIFYSTAIIVVAFIPLFTMTGVPGKIFAPMSITYGFALVGALLMAFTLAPVLCSFLLRGPISETDTVVVRVIRSLYRALVTWALNHRTAVVGFAAGLLVLTFLLLQFVGGEFMPALEEGNLWVRATMPVDISFDQADRLTTDIRRIFRESPEIDTIVSQLGRPDDGTDPTSFFNAEFLANLKPQSEWRTHLSKDDLIEEIETRLRSIPGVIFNFSQVIQDNVEEAMSGVKGENSIKLFGTDLKTMEAKAVEIEGVMKGIRGVKDLGIFRLVGQPNLLIQVDREASARYGLQVADVNAVVQAAVGGQAVTQVYEGERLFDLVVRFLPEYRQDVESIGNILVSTPEGARIPLKQLATITTQTGAFIIYRENNERYIPIKFSVRDRDLQSTVEEAQAKLGAQVTLPERYRMEWAGQYDQLKDEQQRLAKVVPVSLVIILFLLYTTFDSLKNALLVLVTVPFALVGGVLSLAATQTHFSISAAVGVISTLGVAILGGVLLISRIEEFRRTGLDLREAVLRGADVQMRPILMATLAAAIGLLPAALATGIGSQAQKPLARVVVGGMLTAAFLILVVLPVLYEIVHRHDVDEEREE
ncbi:efflux RND transporter permease subunit [Nitrospira moscoviensis]|uniref:Putative Heavy metal efflux pump, CzcA family, Acriflavine resistance protein B n=1 Tax=Nitrospira moscoviensis TaxID=42253 RepID=A0A0K2GCY9_NITMO|nr:CusA/CzcA family heavy metal efflux RND transporter [Nitrospira moscoviensis]ALA58825.1 putative Heavy metal efflux pump, CzcA family, Acriflavine resistance protein B [Nitrospira moscoviensis]